MSNLLTQIDKSNAVELLKGLADGSIKLDDEDMQKIAALVVSGQVWFPLPNDAAPAPCIRIDQVGSNRTISLVGINGQEISVEGFGYSHEEAWCYARRLVEGTVWPVYQRKFIQHSYMQEVYDAIPEYLEDGRLDE